MSVCFFIALVAVFCFKYLLHALNLRYLARHGEQVPAGWESVIDPGRLARSSRYTLASSRLELFESLVGQILTLVFVFWLLPGYDRWIVSLSGHLVLQGLCFFGLLALVQGMIGLPFSAWKTFVLEERFGFNRTGWRLWCADLLKGLLVSGMLFGLLIGGAMGLILWSPQWWWLLVWGFVALLSLLLLYISPSLIEPLFFKFAPLDRPDLEAGVRRLAEETGISVSKVLQVDASRRSGHSNAYFSGVGRVKRIVLFDTLLEQLDDQEILAVLAHELGHWKHGHLRKRLLSGQAVTLLGCLSAWWLLQQGWLPGLVGSAELSFCGRLVIVLLAGSLVGFCWTPVSSWLSRRHEWQADAFACRLTGHPDALGSGLRSLARENLSNLHPHPLYARFYYSHPPVVERVARLEATAP